MRWNVIYFDDQPEAIKCYEDVLSKQFNIIGEMDPSRYSVALKKTNAHALIIDIHMPLMNGFILYEKIKNDPDYNGCPILFISGDVSDENKFKFFQSSAVDFLSRDLSPEELILRLSNKIRFYLQTSMKLELGNLTVDVSNFKTMIDGQSVELTLLEMRMLTILLRNFPEAISRADMIETIYGKEHIKLGTINTHLTNMKVKIYKWNYQIFIKENNILIKQKI